MLTAVCQITQECVDRWVNADNENEQGPTEADRLLVRFLYKPEPPHGDYNLRRRLKAIVRMANAETVQGQMSILNPLSPMISGYNGTPFLLRDSTSFREKDHFMVLTVDVNLFGKMAKKRFMVLQGIYHGRCVRLL